MGYLGTAVQVLGLRHWVHALEFKHFDTPSIESFGPFGLGGLSKVSREILNTFLCRF